MAAIAAVLAATLALAACDSEIGTGPRQTETREVEPFDAINLEGAVRLEIELGSPVSLTVEGRESSVQSLQTQVRDHTLFVKSDRRDWITIGRAAHVKLRITLPKLVTLNLQGGNDVQITGLDGGDVKFRLEGGTLLKAAGQVDSLNVALLGAGHADLNDLIADEVKITVDGVGSVLVHPKRSLDATMNGVGAIFYTGNPSEVSTHMNGLGTIARGEAKDFESRGDRKRRDRKQEREQDQDREQIIELEPLRSRDLEASPDLEAAPPEHPASRKPKPFKMPDDEPLSEVI
ncbi:MAG TPA: head GIN domain-containing protein [Povalibacter sp.]|nr:head GIN domain-containing protein [Povalibacter sp.]